MVSREKWTEIIKDFHQKPIPKLIERDINIPIEIPLKRSISIIGPRRAGKTYTMFQIIGKLLEKMPIQRTLYVNLERADLGGLEGKDLMSLTGAFFSLYPDNKNKKIWLFLDEVQNVADWEKFVRTEIDNENMQVFLSGSSSRLLSKEIATSMRGRNMTYTLLPFSFSDYLAKDKLETKNLSSAEKALLINRLDSYIRDGGYPEVVLHPEEKDKILNEILETTIYKDVVDRYRIRNIKILKIIIKSLIASSCREFSVHRMYKFIKSSGIKASKNTIYNYCEALEDVFFIFQLKKFSPSNKEMEQSLPKVYLVDNGLLTSNGISDRGKLMENTILAELKRRGDDVYYYKSTDKKEVDFVVLKNKKPKHLIQSAISVDDMFTKDREISSLLKASKELKCNDLLVITWDFEAEEKTKGKTIKYTPLWKFLLNI